jgi:hypothetical protein
MGSKTMMWLIITIVSLVFEWIGSLIFGGGLFGLWSNILAVVGCFAGLWFWFKYMRNM